MHRTRNSLGALVVFSLLFLALAAAVYFTLHFDPVSRRLEALPYYAQTYVKKVLPKPALPTPPAVSHIDAETLLQARGEAQPESAQAALGEAAGAQLASAAQVPASSGVKLVESKVTEIQPIAPQVDLSGFEHEWQTWNNCGPATVSMDLSYYGYGDTQVEAARFLKPNQDDKNVSPEELVAYARSAGYEGLVGHGGSMDLVKRLLSNGFPVVVESWAEPEDHGGMGHYRLVTGYSQAENRIWTYDSLNGPNVTLSVDEFDQYWRVFNRLYLVVFPPEATAEVHAILGSGADTQAMHEAALRTAQEEARANPADAIAWFNVGTNYARLGEPALAASAFDEARRIGLPYRMLWYQFDIFEAYLAVGRYQEVVELATATLRATGGLEELYYYRGLARQALGEPQAAIEDFQAALAYNPHFYPAAQALGDSKSAD